MGTFVLVTRNYQDGYYEGWDSRMSNIYVNPYYEDFETIKYQAWKDGWHDADQALKDDEDGSQLV